MPAALLTIFIKQALQMRKTTGNTYKIFSPSEVLTNLNRKMTAQKLSGYQFATCCYCLLNTDTMELKYARAGHPYPVLLRPGQQPKQLEVRGSLLGIFEQAQYVEKSIQLEPGDKIVLYSDGAEPFIGDFDEAKGFHFNEHFLQNKDLPVKEMFENLIFVFGNSKLNPSEIDDISTVGLEFTA
jgi:sigma-B regulation protein RsbU (phosphoserine phosphatase)